MKTRSDRTWTLPKQPWVMRMTWSDLLFAHWPIDPDLVAATIPPGATLDIRDGMAWVGVVPFVMSNVVPRWIPPIPGLSRFPELNLRTYIVVDGKPGVWFFSCDASNRIAVRLARSTYNMPYVDASIFFRREMDGTVEFHSRRTHRGQPPAEYEATYRAAGEFFEAQPGSLEYWLTARYCLYTSNRQGCLYRGEIDHPPWKLAPAVCDERINSMGEFYGFPFHGNPHLLFAQAVDTRIWMLTKCGNGKRLGQ